MHCRNAADGYIAKDTTITSAGMQRLSSLGFFLSIYIKIEVGRSTERASLSTLRKDYQRLPKNTVISKNFVQPKALGVIQ